MKQTIYLYANKWGAQRMTKSLGQVNRDEIPIKLNLIIEESAFREPVIEKTITIEDWRQGSDSADVELKELTITEPEAALIRKTRLDKMREVLEKQGYTVNSPDHQEGN